MSTTQEQIDQHNARVASRSAAQRAFTSAAHLVEEAYIALDIVVANDNALKGDLDLSRSVLKFIREHLRQKANRMAWTQGIERQ